MTTSTIEKESTYTTACFAELSLKFHAIVALIDGPFGSHLPLAMLEKLHPEEYNATIDFMGGKDRKTRTYILNSRLAKGINAFPEIERIGDVKKSRNRFGNRSQCSLWKRKRK